jgi:hypothetical protein
MKNYKSKYKLKFLSAIIFTVPCKLIIEKEETLNKDNG